MRMVGPRLCLFGKTLGLRALAAVHVVIILVSTLSSSMLSGW